MISAGEARFLTQLENNIPILQAIKNADITYSLAEEKLKLYQENNLGTYFDQPIYIAKVAPDYSYFEYTFFKVPPVVNRAIISLSNICDNNCYHCNSNKYINVLQCLTCTGKEKNISLENIDYCTLKLTLENLKKLNCNTVIFKIPSMRNNSYKFDRIFKLTRSLGFEHIQALIGSGIHTETLLTLLKNRITPIFQEVIVSENNCEKVFSKIDALLEKGIASNMSLIILLNMELNIDSIIKQLNRIPNHIKVHIDYVLEKSKHLDSYFNSRFNYIKQIPSVDIRAYSLNATYNSCLYGTVYINQKGDIFPCPGLLDFKLGNVRNFNNIFNGEANINIQYFWKFNHSQISKCKDCGLQFACVDCRSFEYQLGKNIKEMVSCQKFI